MFKKSLVATASIVAGALSLLALADDPYQATLQEAKRFAAPIRELTLNTDYYEITIGGVVKTVMYDQTCLWSGGSTACTSTTIQCSYVGGACTYCVAGGTVPQADRYCVPVATNVDDCQWEDQLDCGMQNAGTCTGISGTCVGTVPATPTQCTTGPCQCRPRTCIAS